MNDGQAAAGAAIERVPLAMRNRNCVELTIVTGTSVVKKSRRSIDKLKPHDSRKKKKKRRRNENRGFKS